MATATDVKTGLVKGLGLVDSTTLVIDLGSNGVAYDDRRLELW
jgi:hypothetical protein